MRENIWQQKCWIKEFFLLKLFIKSVKKVPVSSLLLLFRQPITHQIGRDTSPWLPGEWRRSLFWLCVSPKHSVDGWLSVFASLECIICWFMSHPGVECLLRDWHASQTRLCFVCGDNLHPEITIFSVLVLYQSHEGSSPALRRETTQPDMRAQWPGHRGDERPAEGWRDAGK